ncbi:MAG TPA: alanine racemase [Fimbriimonas sp.]|nr:alanine racemase [Fimbriimonas sp.]
MIHVEDLETPTPVIDLDRVEANLRKMQSYADAHGLRLRPHIKTHKIPEFAQRQIELGAVGITCQKLGEAEVMADAGIQDVLISYPLVGVGKAERLAALASRIRMSVAIDSEEALQTAIQASKSAEIGVWVEFDSGAKRTGVATVEEALRLIERVRSFARLRFEGLMTYPMTEQSGKFFAEAAAKTDIPAFSAAGTPVAWSSHEIPGLTEIRHGTYIYHDRSTVGAGAARLDECAVDVLATVVSRPTGGRFILDSGSKTLSSDRIPEGMGKGFGLIREYPAATIERLYEEHALATLPKGQPEPKVGERVRVLPNHVCVVSNLHDEIPVARQGMVVGTVKVAGRGKTR